MVFSNENIKNLITYKGSSGLKEKTVYIKTKYNKYMCLNNIDGNLAQSEDITREPFKIKGIISNKSLYIFKENNNNILNIYFNVLEDSRRSYCYKYNIEIDASEKIFLKSPKTNKYICFIPIENGGNVTCNRDEKSDWEEVSFEDCNDTFKTDSSSFPIIDYNSFKNYISLGYDISYNDFMINISGLDKKDKSKISAESNNILNWIL